MLSVSSVTSFPLRDRELNFQRAENISQNFLSLRIEFTISHIYTADVPSWPPPGIEFRS